MPTFAVSLSAIPLPPIASKQRVALKDDDCETQKTPPPSPVAGEEDTTLMASPYDANNFASQLVVDQSGSLSSSTKSGKLLLEEMFQAAQSAGASLGEGGLGDSLETASSTRSFPIGNPVRARAFCRVQI